MRTFAAAAAAALFAASAVLAATSDPADHSHLPFNRDVVPGAFIVELSSAPSKRGVHDDFLGELDKRAAGKFVTRKKFASPIFNGVAVELKSPTDVVDLASIPNVVSVRPVYKYPAPKPVLLHVAEGPGDPAAAPYGQSVHAMTGVDKVHTQGFTGKGIKIGIIDTGIDYMHPNLGGGFGPGFKVAGGYDFVGDDYWPGELPAQPDDDPRDTCAGHGTHVAGIVAAAPGNDLNVTGVAYDATLYAYRVFGCRGGGSDDIIIDALIRAYEDNMDVITLSLGIASNWSDEPLAVVASRIAAAGKVVTVSAGNDGRAGPFFMSSPGTGKDVIAVGSVENVVKMYRTFTTSVEHAPVPYTIVDAEAGIVGQPLDVPETPLPIYALQSDPLSDTAACSELGDDVPDLSNYIVVLRAAALLNPTCYLGDQITNIGNKGARFFIVYDPNIVQSDPDFPRSIVILRNIDDGIFLVNEFNKGNNVTVTFAQHGGSTEIPNLQTGGLMSAFSSYGPSQDLLFKPALSAPGGNITSTWLTNQGSWAIASGTSMSAPYMAGSAAVLLQARGKAISKRTRTIFQSTAVGLPQSREGKALPQTLTKQGAGLINVFNALNAKTEVSPSELLLNDTAHWKGVHKIVIKNNGKLKQNYVLSHQPAGTAVTMPTGHYTTNTVPLIDAPAIVKLSQTHVTLAPGATVTVTANIVAPKNLDPKTLPLVSGWIHVQGSSGDRLQVSYLGVAGSLYDAETIGTGDASKFGYEFNMPSLILPYGIGTSPVSEPQIGPHNFTLDGPGVSSLAFVAAQNSARVVVDLIDAKTNVHATIPIQNQPERRSVFSGWWRPGMPIQKTGGSFDDIPIIHRIADDAMVSRMAFSGSSLFFVDFPYSFDGNTPAPAGQYRYLLRALRQFGNPRLEKDYDVYVSDIVRIVESL